MEILIPDIPVIEKLLRTAAIYGFLLVSFRLAGKRQLGQMSPFDLIVLLVISNAVQNALIGNDNSLGGGLTRRRRPPRDERAGGMGLLAVPGVRAPRREHAHHPGAARPRARGQPPARVHDPPGAAGRAPA